MVRGLLNRLLFGREGVARAEAADARLEAAERDREGLSDDLGKARDKLRAAVGECEATTRKLASDPPPVVRFIVPDDLELEPDPRGSRP